MIELRDIFATRFDHDSLNDFAMELGVDYENLSGSSKSAKARELALYLWRHSKLDKLAEVGPKRRPDIDWAKTLNPHVTPINLTPQPPTSDTGSASNPAVATKLDFRDLQKLVPILAAHGMFQTPDSRGAMLAIAGVAPYVNLDLNGTALFVASNLLAKLNDYGAIAPGDTAIGRLLAYVISDPSLPPANRSIIEAIGVKYNLNLV
jgi:hypothetical protein